MITLTIVNNAITALSILEIMMMVIMTLVKLRVLSDGDMLMMEVMIMVSISI